MAVTLKSIAILLHDFNAGGTEATALRLAAEWIAAGHRVTIIAGAADGPMRERVPAGADVHLLSPPVPRSALSRLRLGGAMVPVLLQVTPDVAYITGNFHFWLAPAIRRALPHLPIVAKISNPLLPDLPAPLRAPARASLRQLTDAIDLFVAMSPELAARDAGWLPGRPVRVAPEPNLPRDHHALPRAMTDAAPHILAIGRLEPQKDMALALHSFAALRAQRPARLTILGDGPDRARLEALSQRLGISADVAMPGFVGDVAQRLSHAACLLMTSRYEGFPAVPVEALAADVPVVTTDCSPVLRGLIATPLHGEVVADRRPTTLAAALTRAIALPPMSGGIRPASAAPYSAPAAARRYLKIFDEAIALAPLRCK